MPQEKNSDAQIPPAKRLRVLILSPDPRVLGGVTNFISMVVARLQDYDVTWMPIGSLEDVSAGLDAKGEGALAKAGRLLSTPFKVAAKVRRRRFDIVHINPSFEEKSLTRDGLILLVLRCIQFRHVLIYFHGWRRWLEQRIARTFLLKRILVWLLNGGARIAVLSPEFASGLGEMGVQKERIVVTRTMFDGAALNAARTDPPLAGAPRVILFMSRFARKKGVYELLEAFARIAMEYHDVILIMAGDGEEDEGLKTRAKALGLLGRVIFTGYVEGAEKWRLLQSCTIFALPTYFAEGMPVALLEAMGAGKPVLASNAGGIRYILSPTESGVVLDQVTVDNVTRGLKALLTDGRYRERAGAYNAQVAWQYFEASVVMKDIESLYRDIAKVST